MKLPETFAPTLKTINERLSADSLSAYKVCLKLEGEVSKKDVKYARVLGYMVLYPPSSNVLAKILEEIHSCGGKNATLVKLGKFYVDYYIQGFKKHRTKTPASSEHASRPSFDKDKGALLAVLKEAPQDRRTAKKQALIRDGYRCVVTGKYHAEIPASFEVDEEDKNLVDSVFTQCAHVVPEATYFDISDKVSQAKKLCSYGFSVDTVLLTIS
ncbi:hypothetical protein E1B28_003216 [Marasmius oreades]|uniref:Uncharacterized protein n=1 Tax=Marasmius oreades TaxID=181124 RepID=A0A9P7RM04_9AGAR|nr:uncharacterized protein E1B28_003216 [Marasmius oreades]KAG7085671.1 hypothetical protein E1B28_003216 [Marasmius oreades]